MVIVAQPVVAVHELSIIGNDICFALPAGSTTAEERCLDPGALDRFKQAFVFADVDGFVGFAQPYGGRRSRWPTCWTGSLWAPMPMSAARLA